MIWRERGDAPVIEPEHEGFGSLMMRQAARQLDGTVGRVWTAEGVVVDLRIRLARDAGDAAVAGAPAETT